MRIQKLNDREGRTINFENTGKHTGLQAYMNTKIMRITCIFEQNSLHISKLIISKLQNHFADFILPIPIPFKMIFQTSVCKFFKLFKYHFWDMLFKMSILKIIFQIAFSKYIHTFFFQISNFRFLFQFLLSSFHFQISF